MAINKKPSLCLISIIHPLRWRLISHCPRKGRRVICHKGSVASTLFHLQDCFCHCRTIFWWTGCTTHLHKHYAVPVLVRGRNSSIGIATRYAPGIESRWGWDFAHPSRPALGPTHNGHWVFPGGKAAGAWCWQSTPCKRWGHERVGLYLYSPSGPQWPVIGWNLTFTGYNCLAEDESSCSTHAHVEYIVKIKLNLTEIHFVGSTVCGCIAKRRTNKQSNLRPQHNKCGPFTLSVTIRTPTD